MRIFDSFYFILFFISTIRYLCRNFYVCIFFISPHMYKKSTMHSLNHKSAFCSCSSSFVVSFLYSLCITAKLSSVSKETKNIWKKQKYNTSVTFNVNGWVELRLERTSIFSLSLFFVVFLLILSLRFLLLSYH